MNSLATVVCMPTGFPVRRGRRGGDRIGNSLIDERRRVLCTPAHYMGNYPVADENGCSSCLIAHTEQKATIRCGPFLVPNKPIKILNELTDTKYNNRKVEPGKACNRI